MSSTDNDVPQDTHYHATASSTFSATTFLSNEPRLGRIFGPRTTIITSSLLGRIDVVNFDPEVRPTATRPDVEVDETPDTYGATPTDDDDVLMDIADQGNQNTVSQDNAVLYVNILDFRHTLCRLMPDISSDISTFFMHHENRNIAIPLNIGQVLTADDVDYDVQPEPQPSSEIAPSQPPRPEQTPVEDTSLTDARPLLPYPEHMMVDETILESNVNVMTTLRENMRTLTPERGNYLTFDNLKSLSRSLDSHEVNDGPLLASKSLALALRFFACQHRNYELEAIKKGETHLCTFGPCPLEAAYVHCRLRSTRGPNLINSGELVNGICTSLSTFLMCHSLPEEFTLSRSDLFRIINALRNGLTEHEIRTIRTTGRDLARMELTLPPLPTDLYQWDAEIAQQWETQLLNNPARWRRVTGVRFD
jgi:hypothetical protein